MGQSAALYAESSVAQMVAPWLADHLPHLDPTVQHRLVQLTTGILEHQSLLIEEIARGSAFRATAESNATGDPLGAGALCATRACRWSRCTIR